MILILPELNIYKMQTHKFKWKLFDVEYSSVKIWELEGENRLDSEYYWVSFIKIQQAILKNNPSPLWRYVDDWYRVVYENTKILSSDDEKKYKNVWFLQATNINWIFLQKNIWRVVYDDWVRYQKWRIKKWELLIEVKWNTEKLAIVPNDYPEDVLVSWTLFKMSLKDIIPEYVLVYLLTNYWQASKQKLQSNIAVSYINKDSLYSILIPQISDKFQFKIKDLIKEVFSQNELSEKLYKEAENLLLSELDLLGFQTKTKNINLVAWYSLEVPENHSTTNYSILKELDRFDAEYWDYSYFEIIEKIKNYKWWFDKLWSFFENKKRKVIFNENDNVNYLEIWWINIWTWETEYSNFSFKEIPAWTKKHLKKWDIVISKVRTYRWWVAIIKDDNIIWTWAFTVLKEKWIINKETLFTFLKLKPILYLTEKFNTWTSYPTLNDEDILNLLIPKIENNIQKIITQKIQESFIAKTKSKNLLEIAKKWVEIYIEEDEGKGFEFINNNV